MRGYIDPVKHRAGIKSWRTRVEKARRYEMMAKREFKEAGKSGAEFVFNRLYGDMVDVSRAFYHMGRGFLYRKKVKKLLNR